MSMFSLLKRESTEDERIKANEKDKNKEKTDNNNSETKIGCRAAAACNQMTMNTDNLPLHQHRKAR